MVSAVSGWHEPNGRKKIGKAAHDEKKPIKKKRQKFEAVKNNTERDRRTYFLKTKREKRRKESRRRGSMRASRWKPQNERNGGLSIWDSKPEEGKRRTGNCRNPRMWQEGDLRRGGRGKVKKEQGTKNPEDVQQEMLRRRKNGDRENSRKGRGKRGVVILPRDC